MCTARQLSTRQPRPREVGRGGGFWLRFQKQSAGETMEEPGVGTVSADDSETVWNTSRNTWERLGLTPLFL